MHVGVLADEFELSPARLLALLIVGLMPVSLPTGFVHLGWPFALFKVAVAVVTGSVGGALVCVIRRAGFQVADGAVSSPGLACA